MRPTRRTACLALMIVLLASGPSWGQMFGSRMRQGVTNSAAGSAAGSAAASAGGSAVSSPGSLLDSGGRPMRPGRRAGEFVGTDKRDRQDFIGARRAAKGQSVVPPVAVGPIERSPAVNTTSASSVNRQTGAYEPRVAVGFDVPGRPGEQLSGDLARRLRSAKTLDPSNRIEVSTEGRTAILRGEVASERDRALIELLVQFEPGISDVRNELKVRGRASPGDREPGAKGTKPPQASKPPKAPKPQPPEPPKPQPPG